MAKKVSTAQLTVTDQNDYIHTGLTPPKNPIADLTLWIDTSTTPSQQKRWTGTEWETINEVIIGGRNILKQTKTLTTTHSSGSYTSAVQETIDGFVVTKITAQESGYPEPSGFQRMWVHSLLTDGSIVSKEKYVLSFDYKTSHDSTKNCKVLAAVDYPTMPIMKFLPGTSGEWKRGFIYLSWELTDPLTQKSLLIQFHPNPILYDFIFIRKLKLEKGNMASDWSPAPEDVQAEIEASNNYIAAINVDLQKQIDGVVDSWFYDYVPTTGNYPASEWTTAAEKKRHVGDTFTNTQPFENKTTTPHAGESWRWLEVSVGSNTFHWSSIADSDAVKALLEASKAQITADGKRRVFTTQPTNSEDYDIGDLWVNATYGAQYANDLLKCKTAKEKNVSFNINHWEKASKYTDDTKVDELEIGAVNLINDSQNGVKHGSNSPSYGLKQTLYEGYSSLQRIAPFDGTYLSTFTSTFYDAKIGELYTQSVDIKTAVTGAPATGAPVRLAMGGDVVILQPSDEWTRINATLPATVEGANRTKGFNIMDLPVGQELFFRNYKVEKGTKATAWTPSTADVQKEIDGVVDSTSRNLIINSSFELGMEDWMNRSGGRAEIENNTGIDGGKCLHVYNKNTNNQYITGLSGYQKKSDITVEGGETYYTITFMIKILDINFNIAGNRLLIGFGDAGGRAIQQQFANVDLENPKWHQASITFKGFGLTQRFYVLGLGYEFMIDNIKMVRGERITDWSPAPEDQGLAIAQIDEANKLLAEISDDNILSPSEKQTVKKEWEKIQNESISLYNQSGTYSFGAVAISRSLFKTKYEALQSYLSPLLTSLTTSSTINGATFRLRFKEYYEQRENLTSAMLNGVLGKAEEAYSNAGDAEAAAQLAIADIQLMEYLKLALTNDAYKPQGTDIGLLFSKVLQMRDNYGNVHSGMSGLIQDNVGFWTGGDYLEAIAGVAKIILRKDGSGHLAGGKITWGSATEDGEVKIEFTKPIATYSTQGRPVTGMQTTKISNTDDEISLSTNVVAGVYEYQEVIIKSQGIRANFAGIGNDDLITAAISVDAFGNEEADDEMPILCGVYGRVTNNNNNPSESYGGYFERLRADGFYARITRLNDDDNNITLSQRDYYIPCYNNSTLTIYLPTKPQNGHQLIFKLMKSATVIIRSLSSNIFRQSASNNLTISDGAAGRGVTLIWDGTYWGVFLNAL